MFPLPEEISLPFDTAPNSLRFSILFSPLESLSHVYRDFNSSSSIILIAFPPGEVLTQSFPSIVLTLYVLRLASSHLLH